MAVVVRAWAQPPGALLGEGVPRRCRGHAKSVLFALTSLSLTDVTLCTDGVTR
ncbi:MAG TPA: hypothetical protein VE733_24480 [Streptosporangiaceae bacterium]|nr:hypothetical protein [Streptosporangiaceae bacterium]